MHPYLYKKLIAKHYQGFIDGVKAYRAKQSEVAFKFLESAYEYFKNEPKHSGIYNQILYYRGIIYSQSDRCSQSDESLKLSFELSKLRDDPYLQIKSQFFMAYNFFKQKDYRNAEKTFISFFQLINLVTSFYGVTLKDFPEIERLVSKANLYISICYFTLTQYKNALMFLEKLLKSQKINSGEVNINNGRILYGNTLFLLKRYAEAQSHLEFGSKFMATYIGTTKAPANLEDIRSIVLNNFYLGINCYQLKRYDDSIKYLLKCIDICKPLGLNLFSSQAQFCIAFAYLQADNFLAEINLASAVAVIQDVQTKTEMFELFNNLFEIYIPSAEFFKNINLPAAFKELHVIYEHCQQKPARSSSLEYSEDKHEVNQSSQLVGSGKRKYKNSEPNFFSEQTKKLKASEEKTKEVNEELTSHLVCN